MTSSDLLFQQNSWSLLSGAFVLLTLSIFFSVSISEIIFLKLGHDAKLTNNKNIHLQCSHNYYKNKLIGTRPQKKFHRVTDQK